MTLYTADTPREWREKGGSLSKKLNTEFGLLETLLDSVSRTTDTLTITKATITLAGSTKINLDGPVNISGAIVCDAAAGIGISLTSNYTDAIKISGTTIADGLEISSACSANAINIAKQTTTGIRLAGGGSYNPIHIGTKANTVGSGLDMSGADSYDDHNGVMIFCDDGGSLAATYTTSAIWTRYLISQSQSSNTATGAYLQMKSLAATFATCDYSATKAYLELAGAVTLSSGGLAVINAGLELGGAFTDTANMLSGIDVNLNDGTNTLSTAKNSAGVRIRKTSGSTAGWPIGLYIEASGATTGIEIGTCTTGMSIGSITGSGLVVAGSLMGFDLTITLGAGAAANANEINFTDNSTGDSGYARALWINAVVAGDKTTSGEHNSFGIDQHVTGNTPYLYGMTYYSYDTDNPTIGFAAPISIYQDDLGTGLGAWVGIDIGSNFTNAPAGRHAFFRCRNHNAAAVPNCIIQCEGAGGATYLLNIDAQGNMLSATSGATTPVEKIAVKTPAGTRYIKLFSDA